MTPSSPTAASPPGAVGDIKPTKPAKPFEPGAPGPSTALPPDEGKPSGPLGNNPLAPVSGIADLTRGGGLPWGGLLIVLLASAVLAGAIAGWRWRHKLPFFKPVPDEVRIAAFARVARSGADLQHRIAERRIAHGSNGVNRRGPLPVGTVAGPHGRANRVRNGVPAGAGGPNGAGTNGAGSEAGTNGATNGAGSDVATHREPASPGERAHRP